MIYTAKEGIEKRTKEKILTAELIIVPLIMFGVTAYGLMGSPGITNNPDSGGSAGVTLGASTEMSAGNGSATVGSNADTAAPGAEPSFSAENDGSASASSSSAKKTSAKTSSSSDGSPVTGGRGGGDSGDTSGAPVIGAVPILPYVYCNPAIDSQTGGKRVLATDGFCITVN